MARLPALIDALAAVDGRPRVTIDNVGRAIREAGLIQTTKRGLGAAEMTARDAAYLLIGLYGSDHKAGSVAAAKSLGGEIRAPLLAETYLDRPDLAPALAAETLVDAVAAVIELGPRLAPRSGLALSDRKSGWTIIGKPEPGQYAATLQLERSLYWSTLVIATPKGRGIAVLNLPFVDISNEPDFERAPPFEVATRIHSDVFIALHRALFPPAPRA